MRLAAFLACWRFRRVRGPISDNFPPVARGRMVKIFMRRGSSSLGDRRVAAGVEPSIRAVPVAALSKETVGRCLCLDDYAPHGNAPQTRPALAAASPPQTESVLKGIPA